MTFILPAQFRNLLIENLKLSVWTDSNWVGGPAIAFYNWQTLSWVELERVDQGINLVSDAVSYIGPDGSIQVRMSGKDNMQACFYLGLGLEGQAK